MTKGEKKIKTRKCSSELVFIHKVHATSLKSSISLPENPECCQPMSNHFKVMRPSVLTILIDDHWPELCRSALQITSKKPWFLVFP